MAKPNTPVRALGAKPLAAGKPVVERAKPIGYVNWNIVDAAGQSLLKSNRGFSVFDNEHATIEEKALVELAKQHGGTATVQATLTIIVAKDKPTSIDVSAIPVLAKAS